MVTAGQRGVARSALLFACFADLRVLATPITYGTHV